MAVADASFNISIDSISFGLIADKAPMRGPSVTPVDISPASLFTSMPSITYKGSLPALMDVVPLIRIEVSAPGLPDNCVTCTPAALPCSAWSKDVTGTALRSSAFTETTEPVRSLFFTVP